MKFVVLSLIAGVLLAGPLRPWFKRQVVALIWIAVTAYAGFHLGCWMVNWGIKVPYTPFVGALAGVYWVLDVGPGWLWSSSSHRDQDHDSR